jgi:hypothetical protein
MQSSPFSLSHPSILSVPLPPLLPPFPSLPPSPSLAPSLPLPSSLSLPCSLPSLPALLFTLLHSLCLSHLKWFCSGILACMLRTRGFIAMPVAHTQAPKGISVASFCLFTIVTCIHEQEEPSQSMAHRLP